MKKAFTLVELLIVVSIIGILAAIVIPEFQNHTQQAAEAAAKDNLRILRQSIERYRMEHNGAAPGYAAGASSGAVSEADFETALVTGGYLTSLPANPLNGLTTIEMVADGAIFPAATGTKGWIYQAQTRTIRLDHTGTDREGNAYYDY
ncbi:MAG: type II secretion system protein [Sedimentisphaerales bacterium]|nr:type II secretion system protein [Sedimentisphaerales bacterium]